MAFLLRDLRYAARGLAKDRGFTALAVVALGLGIGASTAIFSVVDDILLSPFAYRDAGRLTMMSITDKARSDGVGRSAFSAPEYLAIAGRNSVFEDVAGDAGEEVLYRMGDGAELFTGGICTANTFEFFGLPAFLGRPLMAADYKPGAPPVFVMRHKTWVARFNADRQILNKTFVLNGTPRTLVGIMSPRFSWGDHDMWRPADLKAAALPGRPPDYYFAVGRLKRGVSIERAQADFDVLVRQMAQEKPRNYPKQFAVKVQTLADYVAGRFQSSLALVMAAVGLLLLIGCANVANLLLARATTRQGEFAIRMAMGANRWRLVRQLAVESLALAALGAVFGCLLAWAGLRGLVAAIPRKIIPSEAAVGLNAAALLFALGVAALTALIFGLAPAMHASRQRVNETLRSGGRGVGGGFRRARLRGALVVAEVALSMVLLAGAGLLMRSFLALSHVDLGLRADHVLTARIPLPAAYRPTDRMAFFYRTLVEKLKADPGVVDASEAIGAPPYAGFIGEVDVAGKTHAEKWTVSGELTGDGYFTTLRIPILAGRSFSAAEVYDARKLAVVNETFVRKYLGRDNPIGQRVHIPMLETLAQPVADAWFEVIGVAGDAKNHGAHGLQDPVQPAIWVPYTLTGQGQRTILVRTAGDPRAMVGTLQREVWAVDRGVAITDAGPLEDSIDQLSYAQPRFTFLLLTVFALAGLALTAVGVYSVMSYATARQTQEIGIRMALGANRGSVLGMVIGSGLKLVGLGIAIGLAASLLLGRVIASQLWGVSPYDPATLIAAPVLLALTGALACWMPARRATMVDPAVCLRYE